jgi:hypothetical protein
MHAIPPDDREPMTSADQDGWLDLCRAARLRFGRDLADDGADPRPILRSLFFLMRLELVAQVYDDEIKRRRALRVVD